MLEKSEIRLYPNSWWWKMKKPAWWGGFLCGAKDGIRTRDPDLGKVVLYQLSYFRIGECKYTTGFRFCNRRGSKKEPPR
jgi:hypothetical protein